MLVRIINGTYGHKKPESSGVIPISAGDPPIELDDEKARRLISIGVAESAEVDTVSGVEPEGEPSDTERIDELMELKMDQLREKAAELGIETPFGVKKGELAAAIAEAEGSEDTVDDRAPELTAGDIVG